MIKRTIVFRADGGPTIGMGHFIRTLALAEMLKQHFHCVYATRRPTDYQVSEIGKVCHDIIDLPEDNSHFEQFLSLLQGDEIVVLDNYFFDTEYQRAIKSKGCKLVCIDDIHDKHYLADIVINHAEGLSSNGFSTEPYTKLLLGYQYALIRKEFRERVNTFSEKEYACLVMMGGADPFGLTNKIIHGLEKIEFDKPIAVVNGAAQKNHNNKSGGKFLFFDKLDAKEVAKLMSASEFGIFPASTVAIEACAKRLPFVCGYFVDNQKDIYLGIEKNNIAVCVGDLNKLQETQISDAVKVICLKDRSEFMQKQQTEFMDNQSNQRLLKIFQEL
jgi:UDP-2,4-diacetamido-2,4,6-trideoxy-beta-L-altropyranose hydrolase